MRRWWFALAGVAVVVAAVAAPHACGHSSEPPHGFRRLYNERDLTGWTVKDGKLESWKAEGELLACVAPGGGWLRTDREYGDFVLMVDWRIPAGGNSGVGLRFPAQGDPAHVGMEVQVLDDDAPEYKGKLDPAQYTGGIYYQVAAKKRPRPRGGFFRRLAGTRRAGVQNPPGQWNHYEITCIGPVVEVRLNGGLITQANMDRETQGRGGQLALAQRPRRGFIGFQSHGSRVDFKNVFIREL